MKTLSLRSLCGKETLKPLRFHRHLLLFLISLAFTAFPTLTSANHSWGGYHWARTSNPFTLKLGDNVSSAWDAHLGTASSDWSLSDVLDTAIVPGPYTSDKNRRKCSPTSGRVQVCDAKYGFNGWLGVAQIWVSGSHITQGTTKMNDTYFNTSTYNKPEWKQFVMCQEIGHTFGLDHQDENFSNDNLGSCMDYTNNPSATFNRLSNEHPNQHDYDELVLIYAHLDSTTTVGQTTLSGKMPPAMSEIDLEGPGQWGRLIRSTNRGLTELYELDFGGGHKVFTFVIWAEGQGRGRQ